MSKLSKLKGKRGERLKDLNWYNPKKIFSGLSIDIDKIRNFKAQKDAQPFKIVDILEDLLKSQTPKWVNYTILVISFLALIVGILVLLHSYNLI